MLIPLRSELTPPAKVGGVGEWGGSLTLTYVSNVSTYHLLGIPDGITVILFTIAVLATLIPFVPGADFGIAKIPPIPPSQRKIFRFLGPILLALVLLGFLPLWAGQAQEQQTRWAPLDGEPAGIRIIETNEIVEWNALKPEIESRLLPQVREVPTNCTARLQDFSGKRDWIVAIVAPDGPIVGNIWFGADPLNNWRSDGLVRVGSAAGPVVWQTFRRYSDGSYRRQ